MKNFSTTSNLYLILISLFLFLSCQEGNEAQEQIPVKFDISIPMGGNTWVVNNEEESGKIISDEGVKNWSNPASRLRTYFRVEKTGRVDLGIRTRAISGQSKVKVTIGGTTREIEVSSRDFDTIPLASVNLDKIGYYWVEMQGLEKEGSSFPEVTDLLIGGDIASSDVYFVKDDIYWGRRGPSVHLSYEVPEEASDVKWFYNEITVPEGEDVVGSYFMANGFGEGYFGIQVNSPSERRILFSVWSPYKTDNPGEIPEDQKIRLLKKGDEVNTGEFGNEGSGGQSFRRYLWKAGTTYRFLLKGQPSENNSTDYFAYFFAPEIGEWELIAGFRRPKTSTYLTRPHSFLENFRTEMGYKSRKVMYSNQWVNDSQGQWHELTKAKFTADATARKDARLDYAGGAEGEQFFLKNCGFFDEKSTIDSFVSRTKSVDAPDIDFSKLP
ncbi:MAG: DUF3472 domain-containing protein [Cyclobacteriaceae bacterium]